MTEPPPALACSSRVTVVCRPLPTAASSLVAITLGADQGVEQGRLARARPAQQGQGAPVGAQVGQRLQPQPGGRRDDVDRDAGGHLGGQLGGHRVAVVAQVGLGQHQMRGGAAVPGQGQQALDPADLRLRARATRPRRRRRRWRRAPGPCERPDALARTTAVRRGSTCSTVVRPSAQCCSRTKSPVVGDRPGSPRRRRAGPPPRCRGRAGRREHLGAGPVGAGHPARFGRAAASSAAVGGWPSRRPRRTAVAHASSQPSHGRQAPALRTGGRGVLGFTITPGRYAGPARRVTSISGVGAGLVGRPRRRSGVLGGGSSDAGRQRGHRPARASGGPERPASAGSSAWLSGWAARRRRPVRNRRRGRSCDRPQLAGGGVQRRPDQDGDGQEVEPDQDDDRAPPAGRRSTSSEGRPRHRGPTAGRRWRRPRSPGRARRPARCAARTYRRGVETSRARTGWRRSAP